MKTKRTVHTLGEMDGDDPPAILIEWVEAVQDYLAALDADDATEEHRQRVREAWLPLRSEMAFEPSPFALKLMETIWHTTH